MPRARRIHPIGTAVIMLLGLTAGVQAATPADVTAGPAPGTAAQPPILQLAGHATADRIVAPGELTYRDSLRKIRGQVTEMEVEWDHPGLPSTLESLWNSDEYEIPGEFGRAKIHAGTFLLRDEIGSWTGPFGGVEYVGGAMDLQATMLGASGYAGQCAILNVLRSMERGWEMDGLVFDCRSLPSPD